MEKPIPEKLIVRYLSNEATSEEQIQLFNWMSNHAEHQKMFNEYCELWNNQYKSKLTFNNHQALHRLTKKIEASESVAAVQSTHRWWRVAAAVTLLSVVTFSVFLLQKYLKAPAELTYIERTNPAGKKSTLKLSDGSTIHLNAASSLRFPEEFNGMKREVYLEGEAFFEIQKDSLRPFIIHTGDVVTRVLGTSFNIRTNSKGVEVVVASGEVKITEGTSVAFLTANEMLTVANSQFTRRNADVEKALAWKDNILLFENISLTDAARRLEKWYGVKILFANQEVGSCRISGRYKNQSLENVLTAITYATEIQYEIKNKEVKFSGQGCE